MTDNTSKPILCRYCGEESASKERGVWPFCSERCKQLDLGAWASEKYRVEANDQTPEDESETVPVNGHPTGLFNED